MYAVSISFVIQEVSDEGGLVRPLFDANTLHDVATELAFEDKEVNVRRNSFSVVHVVGPLSLVSLSLDVSEFAVAVCSAQVPSTLVSSAVSEDHSALAVTEAA